jgi:hypothetical protein
MTDSKHTPRYEAVIRAVEDTTTGEILDLPSGATESLKVAAAMNYADRRATRNTAAERDRLREALDGPGGPLDSRLEWLGCLLAEIDEGTFGRIGDDHDPSATAEMVEEIRALYGETRAVLSQPGGKGDG